MKDIIEEDNPNQVSSEHQKMEDTIEYKYGYNKGYIAGWLSDTVVFIMLCLNIVAAIIYALCGLVKF